MFINALFRFKTLGIFTSIWLLFASTGFSYENQCHENYGCKWAERYLENLDESVSIEEMVDFLIGLKIYLQSLGYEPPSVSALSLNLKNELLEQGISFEDEVFDELSRQIDLKENVFSMTDYASPFSNSQITLAKKELEVSGKFAIGFTKALGGALLCIVPHPVAWTVGGGLVTSGIIDMMESAEKNYDNNNGNFEDRFRNLPPPPN